MLMERYKGYIEYWEIIKEPGAKKYRGFACVYCALNKINGKIYIGGTTNLFKRLPKHKYKLNLNKHANPHLQASYNKYGKNAFEWYIVEQCSEDNVMQTEQKYLDLFQPYIREFGYNIQAHSEHRRHTQATIEKLRAIRKLQPPTFLGKRHTEETKAKISRSKMGCTYPSLRGKHPSEETRSKMRLARIGKKLSQETKDKLSKALKGRPSLFKGSKMSLETRLKMSLAHQKRLAIKRLLKGN